MILDINGVKFQYKSREVLNDISFSVDKNEILTIMGPNGVGKTTLLKCINRIHHPKSGSILVGDEDIMKMSLPDIAKKVGYVAQHTQKGRLTAYDAILLGRKPHISWSVSEKDIKMVDAVVRKLHMTDLAMRYIDEMSGGELQKVSIARAIVQEPSLLLLDEPTSSLDLKNQQEILHIISEVVKGHEVSAVMTMHDINTALRFSDRFIMLKSNRIFAAGGPEIITPENIKQVYEVDVEVEFLKTGPVVIPVMAHA
ncbi:iron complex transport system ATP-binding protein [Methanomicrobium sp. W14]|uniref:ABC transporter ATP-binding protein n=1 Tax=Methanomicrobium sp. W14 TaxID=2817839 RepID=UPI001AEA1A1B|nr:ABC transporter ATP-binding protein [Methanomicrobium sp. W14]MBP2133065.1 iron complex transport system ATP-binding protein [Methanomicrobium sp. W14]